MTAAAVTIAAVIAAVGWFLRPAKIGPPSFTQLTFRRGNISSARFTSDGNIVLYSAYWNGAPVDTFFIRAGTTESRPLGLNNADLLSVSSRGEMAVLLRKKDTLAWFNLGTLARLPMTGGTPREIVEDVQSADWSPDGSELAIARQVPGQQQLEYPVGKVLYHTAGWLTDIRVSPEGSQIAFLEHKYQSDDRGWVSLVDLKGNARRLTEEFSSERGLAWSPDGREIWFTATRSGEAFELFSVSLPGKLQMRARVPTSLTLHDISGDGTVLLSSSKTLTPIISLPPGEHFERDISSLDQIGLNDLSADGKTYLFQYYGEGSGPSYTSYFGGTDGSPPVRLGVGSSLSLSPDGHWTVTFDDQLRKTILQPLGAGESKILQRPGFTETVNDDTWSPDSRHIVFTGQEVGKPARSYIQDIDGGPPVPLGPEGVTNPIASPDGKAYLARRGESYVIFGSHGEPPRDARGFSVGDNLIRWCGDSRHLFVYRVQGSMQLFELDPDTGSRRLLREIPLLERDGLVGTPRLYVSADGKSYIFSFNRKFSELYLAKGIVR
jgi:Tol biopolymer transport system component